MATQQHADDLKRLHDKTTDARLKRRWRYFQGAHPQVWATDKLERSFSRLVDSMIENYCGLAVGTRVSRLQLTGWTGPNADQAEGIWAASRMPQRQDRLWRWAIAYGDAWLLLADHGDGMRVFPAPPDRVSGLAHDDDPNRLRVAGQITVHDSGDYRSAATQERTATLYYADGTYTYNGAGTDWLNYRLVSEAPGLGLVPAAHLAPYGDGPILIDQIAPSQDRINKLASNKLVAAEFGAFRQRVFFTRQQVGDGDLRNQPDTAIVLDPDDGQAKVQELAATELSNYDQSKDAEINGLFTIASLPRHLRVNPGAPPSGEAIKADEAPLVEAILDHQREMGEGIVDLLSLIGIDAEPQWRNPAPRNDLTDADVVARYSGVGVPWQTTARKFAGWTDDEITDAEQVPVVESAPGVDLFR